MDRIQIKRLLTETPLEELLDMADRVRKANVGDTVHIRALLEFSNYCSRNCTYCGLTAENGKLDRFSMTASEIIDTAKKAFNVGYKTIVLQSGESNAVDVDTLCDIVGEISSWGMIVTLSCGELSYDEYSKLKEAGAKKYLLKHECASEGIYSSLHDGYTLSDRIKCARDIKSLGFEYGGGFLVGLPDEDIELVIDNLLLLRELQCDMAGIGTFIPHPSTKLGGAKQGDYELTLRCIAITRLLLPTANLPVTTSLSVTGDSELAYRAGANVVMVKVTPIDYRKNYDIYPIAKHMTDIKNDRLAIVEKIERLERQAK